MIGLVVLELLFLACTWCFAAEAGYLRHQVSVGERLDYWARFYLVSSLVCALCAFVIVVVIACL